MQAKLIMLINEINMEGTFYAANFRHARFSAFLKKTKKVNQISCTYVVDRQIVFLLMYIIGSPSPARVLMPSTGVK